MGAVYLLTLRQLSGRWRLLIMAVLAAMPVFIALLTLSQMRAPSVTEFEEFVFSGLLAGAIVPLVVLAIATPAFGNEVEDKTLANLTLAPLPRWKIAVPKLLGAISVAAPFIAASAIITSYQAYLGDPKAIIAVTAAALIAVVVYASFFVWLGLVNSQAIGAGLLYIVLWEGFFSGFVSGARVLSVRHWTITLMHGMDARRFAAHEHLGLTAVIVTSAVIFVGFLILAIRKLGRMDVP
jgi:ABC-2 type transport system permease protein